MSTLTKFILARIAEEEVMARAIEADSHFHGVDATTETEVLYLSDPERVLMECAAKRELVKQYQILAVPPRRGAATYADGITDGLYYAVLQAVRVWSTHPDFDPEWVTAR